MTILAELMTAYYTPNDGFTANNPSFYKSKSAKAPRNYIVVSHPISVFK